MCGGGVKARPIPGRGGAEEERVKGGGRCLRVSGRVMTGVNKVSGVRKATRYTAELEVMLGSGSLTSVRGLRSVSGMGNTFVTNGRLRLVLKTKAIGSMCRMFTRCAGARGVSLKSLGRRDTGERGPLRTIVGTLSSMFVKVVPTLLTTTLLVKVADILNKLRMMGARSALCTVGQLMDLTSANVFTVLPVTMYCSTMGEFNKGPILNVMVKTVVLSDSLTGTCRTTRKAISVRIVHLFKLGVRVMKFRKKVVVTLVVKFMITGLSGFFGGMVPSMVGLLITPVLAMFVSAMLLFALMNPTKQVLSGKVASKLV